ncbi:Holliday junction resolvase RuvX [Candidatus Saganbacteria bacterium CG08_land_8_20_14_0_20_45_16]|uniref:Putative pre-16S rRNA nuclease n=1 Tax=Candidatus Saganbacteria bacterium CG08_land_8_20_14_0_20_45_16 TaxID=2014293 RepID=A0A2H0XX65_UNCSA|nr:MAG: Holliday junction resolvase RuvX [Candidatus Saganbacteria bacterium CG08_land_8_20_14_0_20_45_16]
MRIVGLDYGEKRLGVAITDALGLIAQPLAVLNKATVLEDCQNLEKLLADYEGISEVVVGLPKTLKGTIGPQAQKVLEFVAAVQARLPYKVVTWDERFTSKAAERVLIEAGLSRQKRKSVIDKSAAALILQGYLDCRRSN